MNGYEKRTKKKKENIISVAKDLFLDRGISTVSIREIASRAGVSQVTIYNYFGDKNGLAKEVFISFLANSIQTFDEILDLKIPFLKKLEMIMEKKEKTTEALSNSTISKHAWGDSTLQEIYSDVAGTMVKEVYLKFILLGKKEGAIDNSIPTDAILAYLLSSISIMEKDDYLTKSKDYKKGVMNLFLYGLFGKS